MAALTQSGSSSSLSSSLKVDTRGPVVSRAKFLRQESSRSSSKASYAFYNSVQLGASQVDTLNLGFQVFRDLSTGFYNVKASFRNAHAESSLLYMSISSFSGNPAFFPSVELGSMPGFCIS